jgi:hypothetical protein
MSRHRAESFEPRTDKKNSKHKETRSRLLTAINTSAKASKPGPPARTLSGPEASQVTPQLPGPTRNAIARRGEATRRRPLAEPVVLLGTDRACGRSNWRRGNRDVRRRRFGREGPSLLRWRSCSDDRGRIDPGRRIRPAVVPGRIRPARVRAGRPRRFSILRDGLAKNRARSRHRDNRQHH